MYSAGSELEIVQDISPNGELITKFSRTNRIDNQIVNIHGMTKDNIAHVRQTVSNESGRTKQRNYVLPIDHVMNLLTKGNTTDIMKDLEIGATKKSIKKKSSKKKSKKKTTPKVKKTKPKKKKTLKKKKSATKKRIVKKRSSKKK